MRTRARGSFPVIVVALLGGLLATPPVEANETARWANAVCRGLTLETKFFVETDANGNVTVRGLEVKGNTGGTQSCVLTDTPPSHPTTILDRWRVAQPATGFLDTWFPGQTTVPCGQAIEGTDAEFIATGSGGLIGATDEKMVSFVTRKVFLDRRWDGNNNPVIVIRMEQLHDPFGQPIVVGGGVFRQVESGCEQRDHTGAPFTWVGDFVIVDPDVSDLDPEAFIDDLLA